MSNKILMDQVLEFLNGMASETEDPEFTLMSLGDDNTDDWLIVGRSLSVTLITDEGFGYSPNINPDVHPCELLYYVEGLMASYPECIRYEPYYEDDNEEILWHEEAEQARLKRITQEANSLIMPLNTTLH
jgi:hypothetical protein